VSSSDNSHHWVLPSFIANNLLQAYAARYTVTGDVDGSTRGNYAAHYLGALKKNRLSIERMDHIALINRMLKS